MNNEWIYTKDRLPERSMKNVLVTCFWSDCEVRTLALTSFSARYQKFNAQDYDDGDRWAFGDEVLAWMPVPDVAEVRS